MFSLKFIPKGPINNIPALVYIMAWHRPGAKPLSEPMVVSLLTHICVTRPQWVKLGNNSITTIFSYLSHCGLVTPYGIIQLDQHWFWQYGFVLVMACCLTAPSHYLNWCWLVISEVFWHSPEGNFTGNLLKIFILNMSLKIHSFRLQRHLPWASELSEAVSDNLQVIWIKSRTCGCLVTWFCYQLIAKPGNKTATVSWPYPYVLLEVQSWNQ